MALGHLVPGFVFYTARAAETGKDTVLVIIEMTAASTSVRPRKRRRRRRIAATRRSCDRRCDARQRAGVARSVCGDIGTSLSRAYGVS